MSKRKPKPLAAIVAETITDIVACEEHEVDGILIYVTYRDAHGTTELMQEQYGNEFTLDGMREAIENGASETPEMSAGPPDEDE